MRKWGPLLAVCLGTFMLVLDVTITLVALPDIAAQLHTTLSGISWVIDGYALALAAALLAVGTVADRHGLRRVYVLGLVAFSAASLACGLADSAAMSGSATSVIVTSSTSMNVPSQTARSGPHLRMTPNLLIPAACRPASS